MAGKEPNQNNNYYLVGGPISVNTKTKSIDMPPKNSKNCKNATIALQEGMCMTISAADNIVIKDKNGVVITRRDGIDGQGKILTARENKKAKTTRASSNKTARGQQSSSYDRG
ncbi:MAG: hypothetical protein J6D03_07650 [Clostridia bacterium]|nr:hypothetical protein [Clostridia bacterium]